MYIHHTIWHPTWAHCMQTGLDSRPCKDCCYCQFTTTKVSAPVEKNIGPHRVLQEIYKGLCKYYCARGEVIEERHRFQWNNECQVSLDILKEKMVTTPILSFPDWTKEFHVHVDASSIALGVVLAQPGEGDIDHPTSFDSIKFSESEKNYNTTEREGLDMVYSL
jgi:hypothetical protein